jgi:hypothetical protein
MSLLPGSGPAPKVRPEDQLFIRSGPPPEPLLSFDMGRYVRIHATLIGVLVVLSLLGQYFRLVLHHDKVLGFVREFNLDDERNVPSWFQSSTLFLSACLLELTYRARRLAAPGEAGRWRLLAVGFLLMSLDEAASFHEQMQLPVQALRNIPGYRAFSWVVPGTLVVIVMLAYFIPWLRTLPARTRKLLLASGTVYVGGAVGFEAIGGLEAITVGLNNWLYVFTYTTEETLEMVGVLMLIYTLMDYLRSLELVPGLRLKRGGRTRAAA